MATAARPSDSRKKSERFPNVGHRVDLHGGRPFVIGTGLTIAQVVSAWEESGGNEDHIVAIHPPLDGRPDLIREAMEYFQQHRQEIEPDLRSTFESELERIRARGYEVDADGKLRRTSAAQQQAHASSHA
jgi:uncharacterized protein (DUF433 family)